MQVWKFKSNTDMLVSRGNGLEHISQSEKVIKPAELQEIDSYLMRGVVEPTEDEDDLASAQYWVSVLPERPAHGIQSDEPQLVELPEDDSDLEEIQ